LIASIGALVSSLFVTICVTPFAAAQRIEASFAAVPSPRPRNSRSVPSIQFMARPFSGSTVSKDTAAAWPSA